MGRKPNPLILSRFHRGAKLEDASNRYQYTCKACGEYFPKGRMDGLVAHLTGTSKRCPGMTDDEIIEVARILGEKNLMKIRRDQGKDQEWMAADDHVGPNSINGARLAGPGTTVKLPVGAGRKLTGLEALAEASRQVERPVDGESAIEDESLIDPTLKEYEQRVQNELAASIGYPIDGSTSSMQDLPSIAASASNLEALMPKASEGDMLDGEDHSDGVASAQALRQASTWHALLSNPSFEPTEKVSRAATYPRAIAANPNGASRSTMSTDGPPTKVQKVRGKFSDSRRKEVQEIRKKGACLRCKMLRKTCSEGDPCATCKKVESARLWKTPCMRIRLAQAFELYSIGLYEHASSKKLQAVCVSPTSNEDRCGEILIQCPGKPELFTTLRSVLGQRMDDGLAQPEPMILPDQANENVADKLDQYINSMSNAYEDEYSHTVSYTRRHILNLLEGTEDPLMSQAILLWDVTHVLTSLTPPFELYHSPETIADSLDPSMLTPLSLQQSGSQSPSDKSGPSSSTILATYLLSRFEKRSSQICSSVLNELEKRLLRGRLQAFGIFLVAFLLFMCVERMEWFVRTFESPEKQDQWHLPEPPSHYAIKAKAFAPFLCDLLKQRHVNPSLSTDPETGFLTSAMPNNDLAREWFADVRLTEQNLKDRRDGAIFDSSDPQSFELKYAAMLLLHS